MSVDLEIKEINQSAKKHSLHRINNRKVVVVIPREFFAVQPIE